MHILILEARLTGHHPIYLEMIARGLINEGHHITIAISAQDAKHPCLSTLRQLYANLVSLHLIDDTRLSRALTSRLGDTGREIAMRRLYAETYRQVNSLHHVEHVFLPYIDYCLHAISLFGAPFGSTPWSGICMRPSFHYASFDVIAPKPRYAAIKESLFFRLLHNSTLKKLFTIDELLNNYVHQQQPNSNRKIEYLPDPVELCGNHSRNSARTALGIPENSEVILVYGAIDSRKGLAELLAAFEMAQMPIEASLLIVGKQSPWAMGILATDQATVLRKQGRLWEINRFVDAEEQQMVFAASDLTWLGYKNHYSMSGVLLLSALAGKPTISTKQGLIGWYTEKHSLGLTVSTTSPIEIVEAIKNPKASTTTENHPSIGIHSWGHAINIIKRGVL